MRRASLLVAAGLMLAASQIGSVASATTTRIATSGHERCSIADPGAFRMVDGERACLPRLLGNGAHRQARGPPAPRSHADPSAYRWPFLIRIYPVLRAPRGLRAPGHVPGYGL